MSLRHPTIDADRTIGGHRYRLVREIGRGGMGVVYEAHDTLTNGRVALKSLPAMSASALLRFKQEFRALGGVHHPNLVRLGGLHVEARRWYFTMELVEGTHLLDYVRPFAPTARSAATASCTGGTGLTSSESCSCAHPTPANGAFDEYRLRTAMRQLSAAVARVHATGLVHRDVKPANVLVEASGRLVLLDFGLVERFADGGCPEHRPEGTAAYMAPEQAAGAATGPAADWYAVGVILFEALTGTRPFSGDAAAIVARKQRDQAPSPASLVAALPADLVALCDGLLRRDPAARLSGKEVRATLGAARGTLLHTDHAFAGRAAELERLHARTSAGKAGAAVVVGEPGMGKTALCQRFLQQRRAQEPALLILAGKCHPNERVPFNAFDSLIDALACALAKRPRAELDALRPPHLGALLHQFPVLGRLGSGWASELQVGPARDDFKRLALVALCHLLRAAASIRPVVMVVDDLHWADSDSLRLLQVMFAPPMPLPVALLATLRPGERHAPAMRALMRAWFGTSYTELELAELSGPEVASLTRQLGLQPGVDATALLRQTGGHPSLVWEALHHFERGAGNDRTGSLSLDAVIWRRVRGVRGPSRILLELIAMVDRPVREEVLARAMSTDIAEVRLRARELRCRRLACVDEQAGGWIIRAYHDRLVESIRRHVPADVQRSHHARLAAGLEWSDPGAADDVRLMSASPP